MLYVKNFKVGRDSFVDYRRALENAKRVKVSYKFILDRVAEVFNYGDLLDSYLDAVCVVSSYLEYRDKDLSFILFDFISLKRKYNDTKAELLEFIATDKFTKNERDFFRLYVDYYYSIAVKDYERFEKRLEDECWIAFQGFEDVENKVENKAEEVLEQQVSKENCKSLLPDKLIATSSFCIFRDVRQGCT